MSYSERAWASPLPDLETSYRLRLNCEGGVWLVRVAQDFGVRRLVAAFVSPDLYEPLGLQPEIELIDPVVAAGSLLFHAEAMAAGAEDVHFGFVARRL